MPTVVPIIAPAAAIKPPIKCPWGTSVLSNAAPNPPAKPTAAYRLPL